MWRYYAVFFGLLAWFSLAYVRIMLESEQQAKVNANIFMRSISQRIEETQDLLTGVLEEMQALRAEVKAAREGK